MNLFISVVPTFCCFHQNPLSTQYWHSVICSFQDVAGVSIDCVTPTPKKNIGSDIQLGTKQSKILIPCFYPLAFLFHWPTFFGSHNTFCMQLLCLTVLWPPRPWNRSAPVLVSSFKMFSQVLSAPLGGRSFFRIFVLPHSSPPYEIHAPQADHQYSGNLAQETIIREVTPQEHQQVRLTTVYICMFVSVFNQFFSSSSCSFFSIAH